MKNTVNMKESSTVVHGKFGRGILSQVSRAFHQVQALIEHKKAVRHLRSLPDRLLRDIGIERYQIHQLTRSRGTLTQLATQLASRSASRSVGQSASQSNTSADFRRAA